MKSGAAAIAGDWRCRTIKLGGPYAALTIYRFFRCRIVETADGLVFKKVTGSQRVTGRLYREGERMILLGAGHDGYEQPRAYGGPGNTLGRTRENRDEAGILTAHESRVLVGLPFPILESDYDILELRR